MVLAVAHPLYQALGGQEVIQLDVDQWVLYTQERLKGKIK
jgi:hypothetical protein